MKHKHTPLPGAARRAPVRAAVRSSVRSVGLALAFLAVPPLAFAQVMVSVDASDDTAGETPPDDGEFVVRRVGGDFLSSAKIRYSVSGSASAGDDYERLSGRITLSFGEQQESIEVEVSGNDDRFEGDETVIITLHEDDDDDDDDDDDNGGSSRNVVVVDGTASLTILDSPHAVTVSVDSNASEDSGKSGEFEISLGARNESGRPLTIDYSVAGSATAGTDYEALNGEAVIPDGSSSASVEVRTLDDDIPEGDETVEITLTAVDDPRVSIGDEASASLSISDDDADGDDDGDGDGGSSADADGDLVPDGVELRDGTDPNDPASFVDSDGGGTADHIETVTYPSFDIPATSPTDGRDDARDFDGDGLPDRLEIAIGGAPDSSDSPTANGAGDATGNGVTNAVEAYLTGLGMSAVDAFSDFDRDGYPDAREVALGLSALRASAADGDGDGVPNVIELAAGSDIDAASDTDADGVPDAREIALGSDPLDGNSPVANGAGDDDNDGVSNAIEKVLEDLGGLDQVDDASDADGDGLGDADEIRLGTDPMRGEQPVPWIELAQAEFGPARALSTDGGQARARAFVGGHQAGLSYDWSGTNNAVLAVSSGSQTGAVLTFAPATLPPGIYDLELRVGRTVGDFSSPDSVVRFTVNVIADAGETALADADNDGIPDSADDSDARNGFANTLQAESIGPIQAAAGVRLQLGSTARSTQAMSALVTREDIAAAGDGNGGGVDNSTDDFDYLGGIYDFEVTNLPEAGSSVQIVIPQAGPIGASPQYRKFMPGAGWSTFAEDENNRIESAPGSDNECPSAGDDGFGAGLTPGHLCIQLTIEDGGPNDGDAEAGPNGVIKDPGGVGTPKGEVVVGQGSGGTGPGALVVLGVLAGWAAYRRRRSGVGIAVLAGCCLLAAPPAARADGFVGAGAGISMLDPDTAGTPFSVTDDQSSGFKIFGGFDLTPVSPNLSVEAFWADLGQATLNDRDVLDYSVYGAGFLYGIGSVTAPRLSAAVEAGISRLDIGGDVPFRQEEETSLFVSIAGSFAIQRHLFLQLEYEYFADDAQFISLSIVRRFRAAGSPDVKTTPLPDQ